MKTIKLSINRLLLACIFAGSLVFTNQVQGQTIPEFPDGGTSTNDPPTTEELEAQYQAYLAQLATNRLRFTGWLAQPMTLPGGIPANFETTDAVAFTNLLALSTTFSNEQVATLQVATNTGTPTEIVFSGGKAVLSSFVGGHPLWNMSDSLTQAVSISTADLWPGGAAGLSLNGTNMTIGVFEVGVPRLTHAEFQSRVTQRDSATSTDNEANSHATAVASVVGAGGLYNLIIGGQTNNQAAKGMSYAAPVWAYNTVNNMAKLAGEIATNGLRVSNHSYSIGGGWRRSGTNWFWFGDTNVSQTVDWKFGAYTPEAYQIDTNVFTSRIHLPVWTPGNSRGEGPPSQPTNHFYVPPGSQTGYLVTGVTRSLDGDAGGFDSIHPQGNAKNTLTVGAVENLPGGYTGPSSVVMSSFSPFGPTDDGRIKPDFVAPGVNIPMANNSSDTSFQLNSGTSFAAPAISGSLNLLNQLRDGLETNSRPWLASTMKDLIIHTADEAGDNLGPDYRFGWGLMNTRRASDLVRANVTNGWKSFIKEVFLSNGDYVEFPVTVSSNQTFKSTIVWTDIAGPLLTNAVLDSPTPRLVCDLDLRVYSPSGATNFPWVLTPDLTNQTSNARSAAATTGDDSRNNVEQIVITNTAAGTYTVRVTHKGSLTNGQWVSILLSGNQGQSKPTFGITDMAQTATNKVAFAWSSVVGQLYQVQYRDNLESASWTDWGGEVSATKTNTAVEADMTGPNGRRFYRILENE